MKEPTARGAKKTPPKGVQVEISAGGVVFKRTPQGVRLALILDPFAKWAFAKGHVEPGETIQQAALRETREEMGLGRLRIVAPLGRIDFWFRDRYRPESRGVLVHKFVHYFLMEAPSRAQGQPQKKEKIRRLAWVSLDQAVARSGYRDVRPMLARVQGYFAGRGLGGFQPPRKSRPAFGAPAGRDRGSGARRPAVRGPGGPRRP